MSIPSPALTLQGQLVYHDSIRKWFELKLDKAQCGQRSIQILTSYKKWREIEVLRGCMVQSKGQVDDSPTGYYTLDLYQDVMQIQPVGNCIKQKPIPKRIKADPANDIKEYRIDMTLNVQPGDHPIVFKATSAGKVLKPWQAYASYFLTGGLRTLRLLRQRICRG